jgi:predicted deacylase
MHLLVAPGAGAAVAALLAATLGPVGLSATAPPATHVVATDSAALIAADADEPTLISRRIIGYSVNDHPIRAYELGERDADTTVVAIAAMHGNETGGKTILHALRRGNPIKDVHLWIVPRQNPDGVLRDRRHNSHGVDLNRNFPTKWKRLTGWYYSGPRHSSEPETRAVKRFLSRVGPDYVVSFHSPLYGIDARDAKDRPFARRLAREMGIPVKEFDCGGVCHGTLTQWFNKNFAGACVTIELRSSHTWRYLNVRAPRGLVRALGGHF